MPRITTNVDKKRKLNNKRYGEHSKNLKFSVAEDSEDETTEENNQLIDHESFKRLHPVQISPKDVDLIVKSVIDKPMWRSKLDILEGKWRSECLEQHISEASVQVAFEILRDIDHQGHGAKQCCGCCGAKPQSEREERQSNMPKDKPYVPRGVVDHVEKDEEEAEGIYGDDFERYSRSTKFCECPCQHCAIKHPKYFGATVVDKLIPSDLKQRLKNEIEKLENVPEEKKDYHPGANRQVLDLIHPSLYCYVENVSVSEKKMEPEVEKTNHWFVPTSPPENKPPTTNRCQWLPAEFEVSYQSENDPEEVPTVKINSYINNVDPIKQPELYDIIGKVFAIFHQQIRRREVNGHLSIKPLTNEKTLQVIVKAANIIVNPDKPFYSGGTFHKEGMPYEHIHSTCIYYYHSENVKNSYLEFRSEISEPYYGYQQDDVKGCFDSYGLHDGDLQFQSLGAIHTKEDRCIVFRNTDQHRVRHFFPIDPSLPAVRKILVFFIVDPKSNIVSTKDVDIQRFDFLINRCFILNKLLPFPIVHTIAKYLPHFTHEQALTYREDLMNQRKFYIAEQNIEVEREFSLCEH